MARPKKGQPSKKGVIYRLIPEAIAHSSGNGQYEFPLRGLFYRVRPGFLETFIGETDLDYSYFGDVIADYEREHGPIALMYRDDRGTLYQPHTGSEPIPLGTRSVRDYCRPEWTFNKIVYIEKGSYVSLLRQAQWPERNDCAILTSQGHATGAVKDLYDLLGETNEDLTFFCVHDADGYGTRIYQSLVDGTRARPGRKVRVINLGLDPAEAVAMGLPVEPVDTKSRVPVADYLEPEWREWLQTNRIELNAMTSPQFIEWLDSKLAEHDAGKVIPPVEVLASALREEVASIVQDRAVDIVRERLDFDRLVREEVTSMLAEIDLDIDIGRHVAGYLDERRAEPWTAAVSSAAHSLADADEVAA